VAFEPRSDLRPRAPRVWIRFKIGKPAIQLVAVLFRQRDGLEGRIRGNGVPDGLNELDALGNREALHLVEEVGSHSRNFSTRLPASRLTDREFSCEQPPTVLNEEDRVEGKREVAG
jgi:hypothetical protein